MVLKAFASHDWGVDGRNHARVQTVVDGLRSRGVHVWFDRDHMTRNVVDAMCKGIEDSEIFLVFVTRNYIAKVASENDSDNVRREFLFAYHRCPERMMAIRFDGDLPAQWDGPVGMALGCQLYTDVSVVTNRALDALVTSMHSRTSMHSHTRRPPPPPPPPIVRRRTVKERVHAAKVEFGWSGGGVHPTVHTADVLKRMLLSMEPTTNVDHLPLIGCLERVERHLGLEA